MSNYTISVQAEENIVLSRSVADRLIASGNGDAALLYLTLLRRGGSASPEMLCADLSWQRDRLSRAEAGLLSTGLLGSHRPAAGEPPVRERVEYSREEIVALSEQDQLFSNLTAEVQRTLGKQLMFSDLQILAGLYNDVGLPADVIFLLVNHCMERITAAHGPGRRPTMRQIEREGYYWANLGLLDLKSAGDYLKKYASRQGQIPKLMTTLGLGSRRPSPSEEKYLLSWMDMGFSVDAIEEAYDRTMLKCHELKWGYLNKILLRWHENKLHTLQEIKTAEAAAAEVRTGGEDLSWMKEYM